MTGIPLHGPLGPTTAHLCIDMQRLLATEGPWPTPWIEAALERQVRLIEHRPGATVFTRFIPPKTPKDMPGTWRQWRRVTREFLDPRLLELLEPLERYAPPAPIVDKGRYSAFLNSDLQEVLTERRINTLVVSGAETDVCVLATVIAAVDLGYRVIVASDAVCSSSDECHDALMTLYHRRFSEQIEIAETDAILKNWPAV
jgi:nicotinamidase-related amidase